MSRSKSSKRWLKEHFADSYVKRAQQENYRSRAAYKLLEINKKDQLIKPGMIIVDLGAAPGGWSQVITQLLKGKGKIYAIDILPMDSIVDVDFLQGDFQDEQLVESLKAKIAPNKVDLVLSDMAPNLSGIPAVDQMRMIYLAELALDFAKQVLVNDGCFLIKMFHGEGFDQYLRELRSVFKQVVIRKPPASRDRSREVYLLARGFK